MNQEPFLKRQTDGLERDTMGRVTCVDLFCGAGGLTRGLLDAGIRVVRGVDLDLTAKETYERNNQGAEFMHADIRKISPDDIMEGINRSGGILLAGCAPCQPFSKHAPKDADDERRTLIRHIGYLVKSILPDYVLVENVPGFHESNLHQAAFLQILRDNMYFVDERVVDAKSYGVPQTRKRYVLLASKHGEIEIPDDNGEYRTVRDAISHFPEIGAGLSDSPEVENHVSSKLSPNLMKRIMLTPPDGGSRRDTPKNLWTGCHLNHTGHTDTYGRMRWDAPAPTLTCRCTSLSNGRFGHPEQHRAISAREAAAIQSFDDNYVFYSNMYRNVVHIGNAVPPLMAKALGKAISAHAVRLEWDSVEKRQTHGIQEDHGNLCGGLALRPTGAALGGLGDELFRTPSVCHQNVCEVVVRRRQDPGMS